MRQNTNRGDRPVPSTTEERFRVYMRALSKIHEKVENLQKTVDENTKTLEEHGTLLRAIAKRLGVLKPPDPIPPSDPGWKSLYKCISETPRHSNGSRPKPKELWVLGTRFGITTFKSVLVETAKKLNAKHLLTSKQMPVRTKAGQGFVAHSDPKKLPCPVQIADGVFVETGLDTRRLLSYTARLLECCGLKSADVFLRFEHVRGLTTEGRPGLG